jgi:hypothetical protein
MRVLRISTRVAALAAATALLGGTVAATSATAAIASKHAQAWYQVIAPKGTSSIADVGLALGTGGTLNVIWANSNSGGHNAIEDTQVSASGRVGSTTTIDSHQALVTDPDATVAGGRIDAIWNGIQNNTTPSGTFISSRAASGGSWSAPAFYQSIPGIASTTSSDSATTGSDGKPWVAFSGTLSLAVLHVGHPEQEIGPTNACCVYNQGLAVDGKTGATFVAYSSLIAKHVGIFARRLNQNGTADGKPVLLPGSEKGEATLVTFQRVGITGIGSGRAGVYAAYLTGYPTGSGVDVDEVGTSKVFKVGSTDFANGFAGATVTADPGGRLWAAWFQGDGAPAALFADLANSKDTAFLPSERIALPAGTTIVYKVYIAATASRLDLVALLVKGGKTAYWTTQVADYK